MEAAGEVDHQAATGKEAVGLGLAGMGMVGMGARLVETQGTKEAGVMEMVVLMEMEKAVREETAIGLGYEEAEEVKEEQLVETEGSYIQGLAPLLQSSSHGHYDTAMRTCHLITR